jgi:hypothetical protein
MRATGSTDGFSNVYMLPGHSNFVWSDPAVVK